uniref:Ubiquitin carboxyl-terminal hydrolase n=1 Tax=Trichuris muris TaxID=70415 RepID=A0A5S6QCZ0_TRIMR
MSSKDVPSKAQKDDHIEIMSISSDSSDEIVPLRNPISTMFDDDVNDSTATKGERGSAIEEYQPASYVVPSVPDRLSKRTALRKMKNVEGDMQLLPDSCYFAEVGRSVRKKPPMVGLRNLGNTCYMNSVIQCLFYIDAFVSYFFSDKFDKQYQAQMKIRRRLKVTMECRQLFMALLNRDSEPVCPVSFKEAIKLVSPIFEDDQQQDAQEFMIFLLDAMHEELNLGVKKKITCKQFDEVLKETDGELFWSRYARRNQSVIVELFHGLCRSITRCATCHFMSCKFEVYMYFSLPVPLDRSCSLEELLYASANQECLPEDIGWRCDGCKAERVGLREERLVRAPGIFLVHLKRFTYSDGLARKLRTLVKFPVNKPLDLSAYTDHGPNASTQRYFLNAVVNHEGSPGGGHYYSYCRCAAAGKWIRCDDESQTLMPASAVCTPSAYLLFYLAEKLVTPAKAHQ